MFMKAETNIGGLLGKSSRLMANRLNLDLDKFGITTQQWILLCELFGEDNISQKTLAKNLLKSKSSVNTLVKYLLQKKLISQKINKDDLRESCICLTAKGRKVLLETFGISKNVILDATRSISSDDLRITIKTLKMIIINLENKNE